ncbi:MAG: hypothetical protein RLZZ127_2277, partial [Planctomycetota bacterium]
AAYRNRVWWTRRTSNWNQVCNGGFILAALAIADTHPEEAGVVLAGALACLPAGMDLLGDDGASEEGPTYWAYGITYHAFLVDALESALGHAAGIERHPRFAVLGRAGLFHMQTVGAANRYFNYGDAKTTAYFAPVLGWMSRRFDQPAMAASLRGQVERDLPRMRAGGLMADDTLDRFLAFLVVWYDPRSGVAQADPPLVSRFSGRSPLAVLRSGWDQGDIYLAAKGGHSRAEHGHLDIGSFVLDAHGLRWVLDPGTEAYDGPGWTKARFFDAGGPRWNLYRNNTFSHATLTIDGALQSTKSNAAVADCIRTATGPGRSVAVFDLSPAYAGQAARVLRAFSIHDGREVLVEDRVEGARPGSRIRWAAPTAAAVTIDGGGAVLAQGGRQVRVEILDPPDGRFEIVPTDPYARDDAGRPVNPVPDNPPGQQRNEGTRMLAVHATARDAPLRITVRFIIDHADGRPAPAWRALDDPAMTRPGSP